MGTEGTESGGGTGGGTPQDQGATPGQSGTGATPNTSPQTPNGGATPQNGQAEDWNTLPEWARSKYRTVSGDLDSVRRELKKIQGTQETDVQRLQTENEKLKVDLASATGTIRDYTIGGLFETEAAKTGAIDPKLLYSVAKEKITTGADGKPTNLADVLKDLKTSHPSQFRAVRQTPNVDAGAGGGNATQGGGGGAAGGGNASMGVTDWMRSAVRPGVG